MSNLITPEKLNAERDKYLVLDCRFKLNDPLYAKNEYDMEHIKNALFVDFAREASGKAQEHGGRHPVPDMHEFARNMEKHGISDETEVVIYDDNGLTGPARLWWLFKYMGKNNVYVLDGGFPAWKNAGYKTSSVPGVNGPAGKLTVRLQPELCWSMAQVKAALHQTDTVLVDSRAQERYEGLVEPIDRVPGHIPGAVNYPYLEAVTVSTVMSKPELAERFKKLQGKKVVAYCGSGVSATVNVLLMAEIGIKAALYAGSYSDWISYSDNQIDKSV